MHEASNQNHKRRAGQVLTVPHMVEAKIQCALWVSSAFMVSSLRPERKSENCRGSSVASSPLCRFCMQATMHKIQRQVGPGQCWLQHSTSGPSSMLHAISSLAVSWHKEQHI